MILCVVIVLGVVCSGVTSAYDLHGKGSNESSQRGVYNAQIISRQYDPAKDTLAQDIKESAGVYESEGGSHIRKDSSSKVKAEALPSSYSLRGSKHLPPITDQGNIGSCASESITYMQFSNAVSRYIEKYNIDDSWDPSKNNSNTFSPKWTYNFVGGKTSNVYGILAENGGVTYDKCKFEDSALGSGHTGNLNKQTVSWDLNGMYDALKYRLKSTDAYDMYDMEDYDNKFTTSSDGKNILNKIKSAVLAGNVVIASGQSDRWFYSTASRSGDIGKKGDYVLIAAQGNAVGGHAVSIIGYDDNIEAVFGGVTMKGAFLMANSWGKSWKNQGYCWVMYDSVNLSSQYSALNNSALYKSGMNLTIDGSLKVYSANYFAESSNWQFTDVGSKTINGKTYRKYTIGRVSGLDSSLGPFISYKTTSVSESYTELTNIADEYSQWCILPYEDVVNLSGFNSSCYDSKYKGTYWLIAANHNNHAFLNTGDKVSVQGRLTKLTTLDIVNSSACCSLSLPGIAATSQGDNFESKIIVSASPVTQLSRSVSFERFYFTYWDSDIIVGMPDLVLGVTVSAYDRNDVSMKIYNKRVIRDYEKLVLFDGADKRPYNGYSFSGVSSASLSQPETATFYFKLDDISLFGSKEYTDYSWGAKIYCDSSKGNPVTVSGMTVIAGKSGKTLAGGTLNNPVTIKNGKDETIGYSISSYPMVDSAQTLGLNAVCNESDITLEWNPVSNSNGYLVYRRLLNENEWTLYQTIPTGLSCGFTDKNVNSNSIYCYKIVPYSSYNGHTSYGGDGVVAYCCLMGESYITSCTECEQGLKIKWKKSKYADAYRVLMRSATGSIWSSVNTEYTGSECILYNAPKDSSYYYTVQVVRYLGGENVYKVYDYKGVEGYVHTQRETDFKAGDTVTLMPNARLTNAYKIGNSALDLNYETVSVQGPFATLKITPDYSSIKMSISDFLACFGITADNTEDYYDYVFGNKHEFIFDISTACLSHYEQPAVTDTEVFSDTESDTSTDTTTDTSSDTTTDTTSETETDTATDTSTDTNTVTDTEYYTIDTDSSDETDTAEMPSDNDIPTETDKEIFSVGDTVHLKYGSQLGENDEAEYRGMILDYKIASLNEDVAMLKLEVSPDLLKQLDVDCDEFLRIIGCSRESDEIDYDKFKAAIESGKPYSLYFYTPISSLTHEKPEQDPDSDIPVVRYDFDLGDIVHLKKGAQNIDAWLIANNALGLDYRVILLEDDTASLMISFDKKLLDDLNLTVEGFYQAIGYYDLSMCNADFDEIGSYIAQGFTVNEIIRVKCSDVLTNSAEVNSDTDDKTVTDTDKPTDSEKPTDSDVIIKGDADLDGEIKMSDVTLIQKHIAKLVELTGNQSKNADVNGDSTINMLDVTQIQKFIAKLIDKF